MNGSYSAIGEMMNYYNVMFFVYYVLIFIMALITLKSFFNYRAINKNPQAEINAHPIDLIISIIIGAGFLTMMYFMGILADLSAPDIKTWMLKGWGLLGAYILLFIINFVLISRIGRVNARKISWEAE